MAFLGIGRRRASLTASVAVVTPEQRRRLQSKTSTKWQDAAWGYFRNIPEVQYTAGFYGNCLGRCRWYVGKRAAPDEPLTPIPDDDPNKKALEGTLTRVRGRDGTFASLARTYGTQQFVDGLSYLVGEDGLDGEKWEMLSGQELKKIDGHNLRYDADGNEAPISAAALVLRMWTRDPQFSTMPHSPMRAVLDVCESLQVAQAMLTSGDRNRLASNGLLLLAKNMDLPHVNDADGKGGTHLALVDQLVEAAVTAMEDPGSPAAHFPVIAEIDPKFIDGLKDAIIRFDRPVDATLVDRLDYLVRRYSQGIDLPPEIVTGFSGANHWSMWGISDQLISSHIGPMAARLSENLTVGLIWPTLEAMGMGTADMIQYGVWFDPTDLTVNPDRFDDAVKAFDRMAISWEALRAAGSFGDNEAPDPTEVELRAGLGHRLPTAAGDARLPVGGDPQTGPPSEDAIDGNTDGTGGTEPGA